MRRSSISVQMTSCPASARHAPVTNPTYPQPITERRKVILPNYRGWFVRSQNPYKILNYSLQLNLGLTREECESLTMRGGVLHSVPTAVLAGPSG